MSPYSDAPRWSGVTTIPEHITIDETKGTADCAICKTGVTCPPTFGGIPRSNMLASFVVQHAVHTKAGVPSGLTSAGNATKAAREALATSTTTRAPETGGGEG